MSDGIPCMWMRGGTSKGAYFLAGDLLPDRYDFLLRVMGSPDPRQIDGIGGADSLTSKVAVIGSSTRPGVDVDYLFLQVAVDRPLVLDNQNCGNILAGVGPFAIERGLVRAKNHRTDVTIFVENTGRVTIATINTADGVPVCGGDAGIDGVPGTAAPITLQFREIAGSTCGALLPTGNPVDDVDGIQVTMIDNGMPVVILRAGDLGLCGREAPGELDGNTDLKSCLENIRLACGPLMGLSDVSSRTIPKMTLVSPAVHGGTISTRTFIPQRCHAGIGVLGAISVATACLLPGSVAHALADIPEQGSGPVSVEHPTGETTAVIRMAENGQPASSAVIRTARKLFDGLVFN